VWLKLVGVATFTNKRGEKHAQRFQVRKYSLKKPMHVKIEDKVRK